MFKVIEARHVTATERRVIKWMLENNSLSGATKQISVKMDTLSGAIRNLTVRTFEGRVNQVVIEVL